MPQEIHQVIVEVRLTVRGEAGLNLQTILDGAEFLVTSSKAIIVPDHFSKKTIVSSKLVMSDFYTG